MKRQTWSRDPAIIGGLGLAAALVIAGLAARKFAAPGPSTITGLEMRHASAAMVEEDTAVPAATVAPEPGTALDHVLLHPWLEALRATERTEDGEPRLDDAFRELTPEQIARLLALAHGAPDAEVASELRQRLIRAWAERDPWAAAAWVEQARDSAPGRDLLGCIGATWAAHDPAAAIEWAVGLASDDDRCTVSMAIGHELVRATPVDTIRLVAGLPAATERDDLLCRAVSVWAGEDPGAAIAWLRQIRDGALRETALVGAATAWARQDPRSAATLAVEELRASSALSDALIGIAQTWAQHDAAAASAWIGHLPAGELQRTLVQNILAAWECELDHRGAP